MVTVLKLGGSLITDKETPETVDEDSLQRAVSTIADHQPDRLVVVHGGGSFGHHHAATHGVSTAAATRDPAAIVAIHAAMQELNGIVIEALQDAGIPAVPIHPLSMAVRESSGLALSADSVGAFLDEKFVPVLHGDIIVHRGSGASILSGDEIVVALAAGLSADRVGLCSTVPGVLDADGDVVDVVESFADVADVFEEANVTDVTGGMAGKVRSMLELDMPAFVFGLDGLGPFLDSQSAGTRID